ncbi:MAG: hypothetical protein DRP42_03110 [Tenericutes bacterium]|nr:MAG: hypothetical protein DRP42_03110 [Mycoplasmatota bacterium]
MFKYSIIIIILFALVSGLTFADTITLNPTDDAYILATSPDYNSGSETGLYFGYVNSMNTLIKFDLSGYTGVTINSAELRLYVNDIFGMTPTDYYVVSGCDADWDEDMVTWNNGPGQQGSPIWITTYPVLWNWWIMDVKSMVQDFVDGTYDNYGFMLYDDLNTSHYIRVYSREYSPNPPELVLDYNPLSIECTTMGAIKAKFR